MLYRALLFTNLLRLILFQLQFRYLSFFPPHISTFHSLISSDWRIGLFFHFIKCLVCQHSSFCLLFPHFHQFSSFDLQLSHPQSSHEPFDIICNLRWIQKAQKRMSSSPNWKPSQILLFSLSQMYPPHWICFCPSPPLNKKSLSPPSFQFLKQDALVATSRTYFAILPELGKTTFYELKPILGPQRTRGVSRRGGNLQRNWMNTRKRGIS